VASSTGFVTISNSGPNGFAVGGYSRRDPDSLRDRHPTATVVSISRARQVARDHHDWDV